MTFNQIFDLIVEKIKKIGILRKIFEIPFINKTYHFLLAFGGALLYWFPSRKLVIIGVTGTKGKSTTSYLIYKILQGIGFKTGLISTPLIAIGENIYPNTSKQTMLGRFTLQKLLKKMAEENCKYVIVETSSEGILQYRHKFVNYKIGVFTNLSPEHLERHGGFANYRRAKIKLFEQIAKRPDGVGIYNLDDENVEYFLIPNISSKYGYSLEKENKNELLVSKIIRTTNIHFYTNRTVFYVHDKKFETQLLGRFNVYNVLAALTTVLACGIEYPLIQKILPTIPPPPGRFEIILFKDIKIIIDYAHEPKSLEEVYKTVKIFNPSKMICLLGAQGGGRDTWKRKIMGEVAGRYCDYVFLTNEDPYDDDPEKILLDIETGMVSLKPKERKFKKYFKIIDRREAIKQAILMAKKSDVVILTGKGGEVWMCVEKGKKIPWKETEVVKEIIYKDLI